MLKTSSRVNLKLAALGDSHRHEAVYKGQGRLIFAGSAGFDSISHLIWTIHSASDGGYR